MKRRDANIILIALAAAGGGVVAYVLPLSLFELGLSSIGLSETIPAFAPPLGDTAQALLIGASMILCALLVALFLPWDSGKRPAAKQKGSVMSFIFSRLASLTRGRRSKAPPSLEHRLDMVVPTETPVLRRSDAHPDAPARSPLFARRDLGEDALPPVDETEPEAEAAEWEEVVESSPDMRTGREEAELAVPHAPEPLPWNLIEQEMSRILSGEPKEAPVAQDMPTPVAPAPVIPGGEQVAAAPAPGDTPSIRQLVDRLEQGLRRKQARANLAHRDSAAASPGHDGEVRGVASTETGAPAEMAAALSQTAGSADAGASLSDEDLQRALAALRANSSGGRN